MRNFHVEAYYSEGDKVQQAHNAASNSSRESLCFSPVRPSGLGEMGVGESSDLSADRGIAWRKVAVKYDPLDGATTYRYNGGLEQPDLFGRPIEYSASEKLDSNKKLLCSWANYSTPVEQMFQCPQVGCLRISDIVKIETEYSDWSAGYFTTVTTASGDQHKFVTSPGGVVTWYEHGYVFYRNRKIA